MKLPHVTRSRISTNSLSSNSSKSSNNTSNSPPFKTPLLSDFDSILIPKKTIEQNRYLLKIIFLNLNIFINIPNKFFIFYYKYFK